MKTMVDWAIANKKASDKIDIRPHIEPKPGDFKIEFKPGLPEKRVGAIKPLKEPISYKTK